MCQRVVGNSESPGHWHPFPSLCEIDSIFKASEYNPLSLVGSAARIVSEEGWDSRERAAQRTLRLSAHLAIVWATCASSPVYMWSACSIMTVSTRLGPLDWR